MKLLFLIASSLCIEAVFAASVAASEKNKNLGKQRLISLIEKVLDADKKNKKPPPPPLLKKGLYAGIAPLIPVKKPFYAEKSLPAIEISARGVTAAQENVFVNEHNNARRNVDPPATNMKEMVCIVL